MTDKVTEHEAWPARAAGLALLGAVLAVAVERIVGNRANLDAEVWRSSLAAFLAVSGLALAFTLERLRPFWSLGFALAAGATVALIVLWNGNPSRWSAGTEWRMVAAGLVIAIAAPLFQAARDAGRLDLSPTPIQGHAWTNIILWFAAWAFTGLSFLLAHLLAELFLLIGIDLLRDALREGWVAAALIGAALGGAIGLLRDRDAMLGQFQRVAVTILSVLAPVLAVGLVLFVAALPFTGLQPLWETTRATTPILLAVIGAAFILANAVLGNAPEEEARGRPLRWSALALAVVMAPLAIVAAISTWLRIDQYGFSPDRLWALVFVAIVLLIATTYLWTALRARTEFGPRVRPANIRLAIALCSIGLLLATPLIDFGALSTRDQVARLQSGQLTPEQFDWGALRFDFGPAGKRALADLARSRNQEVAKLARDGLAMKENSGFERYRAKEIRRVASLPIQVRPAQVPLPTELRNATLGLRQRPGHQPDNNAVCSLDAEAPCTIFWRLGDQAAIAVQPGCEPGHVRRHELDCGTKASVYELRNGIWIDLGNPPYVPDRRSNDQRRAEATAARQAVERGDVEVRQTTYRQVFVGDKPVGRIFK